MAKERTSAQVRGGVSRTADGRAMGKLPRPVKSIRIPGQLTFNQIREFRLDPTVKLARTFVIAPAMIAGWSVESTKELANPDAVDFIRDQMIPLHDHIMQKGLLGVIDWGWAPFEKVFTEVRDKQGNSRVGIRKLKPLLQDYTNILIDPDTGEFAGLENGGTVGQKVPLAIEDCLVLYQNVEGTNWYGESDLISLFLLMDKYKRIEAVADKHDAKVAGAHWVVHYPIGKSPFGESGEQTDNYLIAVDLLNSLEGSGSIVVPSSVKNYVANLNDLSKDAQAWQIELMSAEAGSTDSMIKRMEYLDTLKVRAFGVPERSILEGKYGTKAEAEEHGDFATVNINLRRRDITRECNWHLVNQLLRMNYGPEFENQVYLVPNPINDEALVRAKELYNKLLNHPELGPQEFDNIDWDAVKEMLKIPRKAGSEGQTKTKLQPKEEEIQPAGQPV